MFTQSCDFSVSVILNRVKDLAKCPGKVPARDPSDATLCQDDNIAENLHFGQLLYCLLKN